MNLIRRLIFNRKCYSTAVEQKIINGKTYDTDSHTNITPRIISYLNRNIYRQQEHPICFTKQRIIEFFYEKFKNKKGNPIFSVYEDLSPIVTTYQNFDSLLVPKDHPSRSKSDCYYINKDCLLRSHMTAHQNELIKMGLNNFLMVGDVYRKDEINASHYPVFHQLDGVCLLTPEEVFEREDDGTNKLEIKRKKKSERTKQSQEVYTERATEIVEERLKKTLEDLAKELFGSNIKYKWNEEYFPFTHPSWELEIQLGDSWIEVLGCGVVEYDILQNSGCDNRIGWAFGTGLERLAMIQYSIPDIRVFWSTDTGFLHQFQGKTHTDKIKFVPFSSYPPCPFDISFWINDTFESQDFYELVREHCGDIVEQIQLIDTFTHPKTGKESRCYRLVYRSMDKILTKNELNVIHNALSEKLVDKFNVQLR